MIYKNLVTVGKYNNKKLKKIVQHFSVNLEQI